MTDKGLCEACIGLVFNDGWQDRTYEQVQGSVSDWSCPFCKAFLDASSNENPDKKPFRFDFDAIGVSHGHTLKQITITSYYSDVWISGQDRVTHPPFEDKKTSGTESSPHTAGSTEREDDAQTSAVEELSDDGSTAYEKDLATSGGTGADEHVTELRTFWMIAYTCRDYSDTWHIVCERPEWQSCVMDMDTRFRSIDDWLSECTNASAGPHVACSDIRTPGYPSRLLDLQKVETASCIRLIETQDWSAPLPEYTTLSHCWGNQDGPRPLETTSGNFEAHKRQIMVQDLPKTFQDAVKITLRLGKLFLWIDSLCIVQQDSDDWEHEATKMAAIYENSFLTIAATSSENCEGGCSLDPWTVSVIDGKLPRQAIGKTSPDRDFVIKMKRTDTPWDRNFCPPLHTRGWVLQEAYLSRRVLHMTTGRMLWQCRALFDQEDTNLSIALSKGLHGFTWAAEKDRSSGTSWWQVVETYSKMNFTYISDKLPAFMGLIELHREKRQDVPLLGLWKDTIDFDLSWTNETADGHSQIDGLPTWTWLSSRSGISSPGAVFLIEPQNRLRLDEWSIEWERRPYVSNLTQGTITVSGKMLQLPLKGACTGELVCQMLIEFYSNCKLGLRIIYSNDTISAKEGRANLTYLLLHTVDHPYTKELVFLALLPAPSNPSMYVRVGCGTAQFVQPGDDEFEQDLIDKFGEEWFEGPEIIESLVEIWEDASLTLC